MTDETRNDDHNHDHVDRELEAALRDYGRTLDRAAEDRAAERADGIATVVAITEAPRRRSPRTQALVGAAAAAALIVAVAGGYALLKDDGDGGNQVAGTGNCLVVPFPTNAGLTADELEQLADGLNAGGRVKREWEQAAIEESQRTGEDLQDVLQRLAEERFPDGVPTNSPEVQEILDRLEQSGDLDSTFPGMETQLPTIPSEPVATDRETVEATLAENESALSAEFPTEHADGLVVRPSYVAVGPEGGDWSTFWIGDDENRMGPYEDFRGAYAIQVVQVDRSAPECFVYEGTDAEIEIDWPYTHRVEWTVRNGVLVETFTYVVPPSMPLPEGDLDLYVDELPTIVEHEVEALEEQELSPTPVSTTTVTDAP